MSGNKQIKGAAIISYLTIAFNILSGLIYTPWMLRHIGQSDYGLYSTATAFISYFTIDFGLSSVITRFVSKYRAEKNEEAVERLLGVVYKLYLALDVVILISLGVVYCFLQQLFGNFTPDEMEKFRVIYLVVGGFTLISFPCTTLSGLLLSHERFFALKGTDFLSKFLVVLCMIVALTNGHGLYALVFVNIGVHLAIYIFRILYLKKSVHLRIAWKYFDANLLKDIFSFSIWVMVLTFAERFIFNIEPTIVGALSGTVQTAIFSAGNTIEGYVWTLANAMNSLFLPKVSRMVTHDGEDRTQINAFLKRIGRIQIIIIGAVLFIFASMGYEFVRLWLGSDYQQAYFIALLMIAPSFVIRTRDIAQSVAWAENKVKLLAGLQVLCAVVNVILSVVLVPRIGALGAGVSIFVGMVVAQIVGMHFLCTRVLHLDMWGFYKNCQLKMIVPGVICMAAGFALQYYLPSPNLMHFILKACVAGAIYVVVVWFLYMNADEKELFTGAFRKIKKKLIKK